MVAKKARKLDQENRRLKAQLKELEELYSLSEEAAKNDRQSINMIYGFVKTLKEKGSDR